ncbi:flagellar basal body rod protein FlgG [Peribacillus glennii]|uniref:Flagellar hook protein FlgE n=1 Tax=Peribacillus glennii TaxID=2303991 RepID=A0A372L864_9BACI|nr:flagellar basal body rod protein FlgG [Peribacillus glennii]RFU61532.1 flagellar basal body rod protein FlgG [Peribacillus glennii]
MLRSMYSGISGMKNFQTKLDVIGNNIANVNTFGYKKGRVTFKDMVSQSISGASAPGATMGGVNPKQVGLGSSMATIDTVATQGSLQTTGRPLDLAISGDGYFMVGPKPAAAVNFVAGTPTDFNAMNKSYTRAGNLYLDQNGDLVNSDGLYLLGFTNKSDGAANPTFTVDTTKIDKINIPTNAQSFSISDKGEVQYVDSNGKLQYAGQVLLAKFPNAEGLQKTGQNLFKETPNSGIAVANLAQTGGAGSVVAGTLEMSNVDLSEEFTEMITAQRGFQANTRIITTSDEILQELVNLKR